MQSLVGYTNGLTSVLVLIVWSVFLVKVVFYFAFNRLLIFPLMKADVEMALLSLFLVRWLFPIPVSPLFQVAVFSVQLWLTDFCGSFLCFTKLR